jgi:hypothetical protein
MLWGALKFGLGRFVLGVRCRTPVDQISAIRCLPDASPSLIEVFLGIITSKAERCRTKNKARKE